MLLEAGEVPADLLERLTESPHFGSGRKEEAPGIFTIPRASSGSGGALRTIADSRDHAVAA